MKRRQFNTIAAGVAAGLGTGLLNSRIAQADEGPLNIGFVYLGPVGDHGWTYQHELGRQAVVEKFGDKVKTTYVENVDEGADAERVIRNLAQAGNDLIFTTSFGYMNPTFKVARRFPKVKFEHATGYKTARNMSTYVGTTYQGRYIAGFIAAKMTKSNVIGYIGSYPIPEVIRDINATQIALAKYNPEATLKVIWVNSWFDPGKETDAANALMDQGADVILQHTDSPSAMQAAERRGKYAIGQDSDMSPFGPKACLMSVVLNWGPYYIQEVQKVLDGTWKSGAMVEGMAEDTVIVPKFNEAIPADVVAEAKDIIGQIKAGTFNPFTGPLFDQDGKQILQDGEVIKWPELEKMNYYVKGVSAKLPS